MVCVGAYVWAAFPASGAGFVLFPAVYDFDFHGGAWGVFFCEGVEACADDVFQVHAIVFEAAAEVGVVYLVDDFGVEGFVQACFFFEFVQL